MIRVTRGKGLKRHFEFVREDKKFADLTFEKIFCSKATATVSNLVYNFRRKGFWENRIDIIAQQRPYSKTHIRLGWKCRFSVRGEDGNMYHFKPTSFWHRAWQWLDATGKPVMEMRSRRLSRKKRGVITFHQPEKKEYFLLMLIGWYQLIAWEDMAVGDAVG